jgi:hypothetical protein
MADIRKKVFLPFFERLKLLDCSCVRLLVDTRLVPKRAINYILSNQ